MVPRETYFFSASFFGGGAGVIIIGAGPHLARGAFSSLESSLPQAKAVLLKKIIMPATKAQSMVVIMFLIFISL